MEDVVLLEVIVNETGEEIGHFFKEAPTKFHPVDFYKRPKVYNDIKTFKDLDKFNVPNSEGLVLKFKDGYRIKFKTEEYKRLHRLITGVSERTVWEAMKDDKLAELIEGTPDEFYDFVTEVKDDLTAKFCEIDARAKLHYSFIPETKDRKTY